MSPMSSPLLPARAEDAARREAMRIWARVARHRAGHKRVIPSGPVICLPAPASAPASAPVPAPAKRRRRLVQYTPEPPKARAIPRDGERQRTYDAERPLLRKQTPMDYRQITRLVDTVIQSNLWITLAERNCVKPCHRVHVAYVGQRRRGAALRLLDGSGEIRLPKSGTTAHTPLYVLHELAHLVTPSNVPAHGHDFRANLLALVRAFISDATAAALAAEYRQRRLRIAPSSERERLTHSYNITYEPYEPAEPVTVCPRCGKRVIATYRTAGAVLYAHTSASTSTPAVLRVSGCLENDGGPVLYWSEYVLR